MKKDNLIFSVVVCTYNGETKIGKAIDSVLSQNFPKSKYEVIVVDDGSSDNTANIAKKYPVKFIKHSKNRQLSGARNTGLKNSKGQIYVCFDDDCFADKNWLSNIYSVYQTKDNIAGVGGKIITVKNPSLLDSYLYESNYMNPNPSSNYSYSPASRLFNYLKVTLVGRDKTRTIYQTNDLAGGNSSFPVEILRSVGGWSDEYSGIEDIELCRRIKNKYPEKKYFVTKKALITHDPKLTLRRFLKTQLKRSNATYLYFKRYNTLPPIFPFPIAFIVLSLISLFISPLTFLATLLISPQIMYFSWLIKSLKKRQLIHLLFPYIQLIYESTFIVGILKSAI